MHSGELKVYTGRIDIAYETYGDRDSLPIVLISGLFSQMISWEEEFCSRLADEGFRVIRFDNRDAGNSSKFDITGMPYTLDDMASDTISLLDALDIANASMVGASIGGMIAQILTMDHPERVRTLTAMMSSSGNPFLPPPRPEVLPYLSIPFPMQKDLFIEYFAMMWKTLNGNELPVDEGRIRDLGNRIFERGVSPMGSSRQLAAIFSSGNRKDRLKSITAPTLVIHGELDPLFPIEYGIDLVKSIPEAKLKVISGMGHTLHPSVWNEIIDAISSHVKDSLI